MILHRLLPTYQHPYRPAVYALLVFFFSFSLFAQKDSIPQKKFDIKAFVVPGTLLTGGLLLNHSQAEHRFQTYVRSMTGDDFRIHLDDYLQYVPAAQVAIGDLSGLHAKHHWFDQMKYLLISQLITSGITHGLKALDKTRPDGAPHSFPSGHTATAFVNATALYLEFREHSPVWAYSGYAFAAATGSLRIANNRHWISDVLVGAGLGILTTHLVYLWQPLRNWNPFLHHKKLSILPYSVPGHYGLVVHYRF